MNERIVFPTWLLVYAASPTVLAAIILIWRVW